MPYYLVLFRPAEVGRLTEEIQRGHEDHIDAMIEARIVLLGGPFADEELPYGGGYVLRCDAREDAERWARIDPYVREGVYAVDVAEWSLIALDPAAADRGDVI